MHSIQLSCQAPWRIALLRVSSLPFSLPTLAAELENRERQITAFRRHL
jgi:hypothetical protein